MALDPRQLPNDIATLKAMLIASESRAEAAETRAIDLDAEIANLKLTIAKMQREAFGSNSERSAKLLDQLELQLAELVERKAENETATAVAHPAASAKADSRKPVRRPLPEHLPRERLVHPAPAVCPCCSGTKFRKLGEDAMETLERVRRIGRSSCTCASASPAGPATRLSRRQRLRIRSHAAARDRTCSPMYCSASSRRTFP